MTEDIEELKTQKQSVLDDMFCTNDKEVAEIEQRFKNNSDVLERIKAQNISLEKQKETEISHYIEIKNNILLENIEAVQKKQLVVHKENIQKILKHLQKMYKQKYSYDIFKKAENSVNKELKEETAEPLSLQKFIKQKQQEISDTKINSKNKSYKYER